ncbi:MAG: FAD-dependent oxidoreductase [Vicinamibacterales bacterium]
MTTHRSPAARPALTRRGFLEQLGAIGGSSLVMSAMSSWDLMAEPAGQRPELTGRPAKANVLVLGAGLSGLVVGYELGKLGYDYQVLEARDRVGGLQWAVKKGSEHTEIGGERQVCTFDEGQYVNVGPWRIPYSHTGVLNYCKELGVPVQVFLNESDANFLYYEGADAGALANRRVRLREVKADITGQVNELLVKAIDQKKLDVPMTVDDQKRLTNFLVSQGYLDGTTRTYKAFANRGEGDPYQLAALLQAGFGNRLRSVPAIEGTTAAPMFQPIGGMDQIAKGFQRAMGAGRITFNAEIQSVHQGDTGVKVAYRDTRSGKPTELSADFVVVCIPMSVLSGIDINLSDEMMQAVKQVTYSNSAKVGLAMKRRFWEEDDRIFGGHLYSNLPIGEFSYPSYDYFTNKGVLLGLYANGPIGNLIDQPIQARIEHVLSQASKVHPQIRTEFESGYAVWWKKVKYNLGGYASVRGEARRAQLSKIDNRILLGSAATTPRSAPDWQEGAVAAGWQALQTIHERAMRG